MRGEGVRGGMVRGDGMVDGVVRGGRVVDGMVDELVRPYDGWD